MLTITHDAGVAITSLTDQQGVTDTGGLQIHTRAEPDEMGRQLMDLAVAELADSTDQVVTENATGARVFLDEPAAEFLDDKVLDANQTVEGDMQFTVRAPATEPDQER